MSRYPQGVWRPVSRYQSGGRVARSMSPRRICLHTAVSNSSSLYPYFSRDGNPCAHFYVDRVGRVEQYIDTSIRSTANLFGNHDIVSIESWDGAGTGMWSGSNVPPWNAAQLAALAALLRWLSDTHGIPLVALPDSKTGRTGVGWHRQGCDPYRAAGGEKWSLAYGKVCPGDKRIAQIPALLREADDDMALTPDQLAAIADAVWSADCIPNDSGNAANPVIQAKSAMDRLLKRSGKLSVSPPASQSSVDALAARLDALTTAPTETVVVTTGKPLAALDIAKVASEAGFTDAELAVATAIALAESNGYEKAVGGPNRGAGAAQGSYDFGLWQINGYWHKPSDAQKFVALENAKMAHKIYSERGNWTPWSVYNSGSYMTRMPEAQSAVAVLLASRGA